MTADGERISARRILLTAPCSRLPARPTGPTVALVCDQRRRSHAKGPCRNDAKMSSALAKSSEVQSGLFRRGGLLRHLFGTCGSIIAEDTSCLRNTRQVRLDHLPWHGATTPTHHPRTPRSPESQLPPWKRQTFAARLRPIARPRQAARCYHRDDIVGCGLLTEIHGKIFVDEVAAWNGARA